MTDTEAVVETVPEGADVPDSPDPSPAVETAPSTEGAETETPPTDGQPRDEHGRFAPKAEPTEPAADAPLPIVATTPAPPPQTPPTPFKWRADKAEHTLEGAVINADGSLTIPAAHVARAKQLLTEGVIHQGSWPKERIAWSARINDSETRAKAAEASKEKMLDEFLKVFENEDTVAAFWHQRHTQLPVLMERIKTQELEARIKAYESGQVLPTQAAGTAADPAQEIESARVELTETLPDFFAMPEFQVFTDKDRKYLTEEITADVGKYIKVAQKDMPEHGIVAGDPVLFDDLLTARLKREVERVSEVRGPAKKLAEAAAFNAARSGKPSGAATVPAGKVPTPTEKPKAYATADDWRKDMGINT